VLCFAGQLNQVFMNVLSNSVDSLIDQAVSQHLDFSFNPSKRNASSTEAFVPTIVLTTQVRSLHHSSEETRWVSICITDNGSKLSPEIQKQLLESFTVERRALKETSLAVSYQIVTAKHGGKFEIRRPSALQGATLPADVGTEFEILLPIV